MDEGTLSMFHVSFQGFNATHMRHSEDWSPLSSQSGAQPLSAER